MNTNLPAHLLPVLHYAVEHDGIRTVFASRASAEDFCQQLEAAGTFAKLLKA
jgi:hypothetical protein